MRRYPRFISMRRRTCLVVAAGLLVTQSLAPAFDTGHHEDLTATVMSERGFGEVPTQIVQVANWLTDYYSVSPTSRDAVEVELGKLHFDNLYDGKQVEAYWGWLVHDTREGIAEAVEADDPLAVLTLMGLFSHAVQDFYAHSNWVETHPRAMGAPYRRETWLTTVPGGRGELFTGSYPPYPSPPPADFPEHGGYHEGLNKDSYIRPLWDEAYVFAYFATHELFEAVREWVEETKPGYWETLRTYQVTEAESVRLEEDVEAARNMSMWVKGEGADGHWKGDESGSVSYLSKFSVKWTATPASSFVRQVKGLRIHEKLTAHLYSDEAPPPLPVMAPFTGDRRAILVQATHVEEKRDGGGRIDRGGQADLYAVVKVGTQRYRDRTLRDKKAYDEPWTTLHIVGSDETEIPIRFEILDEDTAVRGKSDQCDINPAPDKRHLSFRFRVSDGHLTGDVEGVHDAPDSTFRVEGAKPDKKRVALEGYVTAREIEPPRPPAGS